VTGKGKISVSLSAHPARFRKEKEEEEFRKSFPLFVEVEKRGSSVKREKKACCR